MDGPSTTGDKDLILHGLCPVEFPSKTMRYNKTNEQIADERLRRLIADGKPLPPFLKDEVERIRAEDEGRKDSTHRPDN